MDLKINRSKYIVSILFGLCALICGAFGSIHWMIFVLGGFFALSSLFLSLKDSTIQKLSIIAMIVSICSSMILGYSIITKIKEAYFELPTLHYGHSNTYDVFGEDIFDDIRDDDSSSLDFWD